MYRGYIKLWRKLKENVLWKEKRVFSKAEAWIDILMEVRWNPLPKQVTLGFKVLTCHRGESLKATRTWAEEWNWPQSRVVRFLKQLQNMNQIRLTNESVTTRITVVNYELYAGVLHENDSQTTHKRLTSESQVTQNNNDKNEKNEKKQRFGVLSDRSVLTYANRFSRDGLKYSEEAVKILSYLNERAGKAFSESYYGVRYIVDRLAEGRLPEEFRAIIDKKIKDERFDRNFLRPETLFTPENFDKYLMEEERGNNSREGGSQKTGAYKGERKSFPVDFRFNG